MLLAQKHKSKNNKRKGRAKKNTATKNKQKSENLQQDFSQDIEHKYKAVHNFSSNLRYNRSILALYFILLAIGLIIVSSASVHIAVVNGQQSYYYALRDFIYISASVVVMFVVMGFSIDKWYKNVLNIYIITFILLILVFLPGIGHQVNGAHRWINLGLLNFQPGELAKLCIIIYMASYCERRKGSENRKFWFIAYPFIPVILLSVILNFQPDLGTIIVLCLISFSLLFITGVSYREIFVWFGVAVSLGTLMIISSPYRIRRIQDYINGDPFSDPYGSNLQLINSLIAFGRGEFFGNGLGNSIQKLEYLPEAHTDFVLAIFGEEFGWVGLLILLTIFFILVIKIIAVAKAAFLLEKNNVSNRQSVLHSRFKGSLVTGIVVYFIVQAIINLSMNLGLAPTKGLTFPFISFGGSSMLISSIMIGIVLRVDYENRRENNNALSR